MKRSSTTPADKNKGTGKKGSRSSNYTEPEERGQAGASGVDFTQTNQGGAFNPLDEEVINAGAGKSFNVTGDTSKLHESAPIADHVKPTINLDQEEMDFNQQTGEYQAASDQDAGGGAMPGGNPHMEDEQPPFNQEFHEMPNKEQEQSALQTAIVMVEMYAGLKLAVPGLLKVSERKMKKMDKAGEINLHQRIPITKGRMDTTTVQQIILDYNNGISGPFKTSQQFKSDVIPVLARVLQKMVSA